MTKHRYMTQQSLQLEAARRGCRRARFPRPRTPGTVQKTSEGLSALERMHAVGEDWADVYAQGKADFDHGDLATMGTLQRSSMLKL